MTLSLWEDVRVRVQVDSNPETLTRGFAALLSQRERDSASAP